MPLNQWRAVRYTDDGCTEYQCLKCYKRFEGRSGPGRDWKFCPYCGTLWDGERPQSRRLARLGRYYQLRHEAELYHNRPRRRLNYWWVIEKRSTWKWPGSPPQIGRWDEVRALDARTSSVKVFEELRHQRTVESSFENLRTEFRVRMLRESPDNRYPQSWLAYLGGGAWPE